MKRKCAEEALKRIQSGSIIGLGGGSTVSILVELIAKNGLAVQVVTPSTHTAALCAEYGLTVLPTWMVNSIDVAFDGCDEVDNALNALKSGGGIHTNEKIVASLAKSYILLVDESKVFSTLPFAHPVVLEVIPEAKSLVENQMRALGGTPVYRTSSEKDGFTVTDHGNYLLNVQFAPPDDLQAFHEKLLHIPGIVDTSLFYQVATGALIAGPDGVRELMR